MVFQETKTAIEELLSEFPVTTLNGGALSGHAEHMRIVMNSGEYLETHVLPTWGTHAFILRAREAVGEEQFEELYSAALADAWP